eukprot:2424930-Rhodomonas_salina.3
MFRGLIIGVILAAVLDERSNAGAVLSVSTLDFVIHTLLNPDSDWLEVSKNIYRNIMNISVRPDPAPLVASRCVPSAPEMW